MKRSIWAVVAIAIAGALIYLGDWAWLIIKLIFGGGPRGN